MDWGRVKALVRKDLREMFKSKYILSAVIGMPILFAIFIPLSSLYPLVAIDSSEFEGGDEFPAYFTDLFAQVIPNWDTAGAQGQILIIMAYIMYIVVLLIPIILPAVTASETIIGEKERKTMEALLASPLSETELVTGKILSSFIPSVAGTAFAALIYSIITNIMIYPYTNSIMFLDALSLVFLFVIAPLLSILSVELMILISTRVTSVRDAYQLGSLVVLPLMMLIVGVVVSYLFISTIALIAAVALLLILCAIFFKIATNVFDRERAIVKLV
ncbi:MAG: ABC transporter permease [Candidatus Heimdallarchaeota archaeon]|nr:ABC transporter permease [Candidatus Heimdallarchaeota archaeon]